MKRPETSKQFKSIAHFLFERIDQQRLLFQQFVTKMVSKLDGQFFITTVYHA